MHLRRALLLFAIVLGLAAIAASVSRPRGGSDGATPDGTPPPTTEAQKPPTAAPAPETGRPPVELTFFAAHPGPQEIRAGQAATVLVDVQEPGQVDIADLGLSDAAEPLTPAQFDVFTGKVGRYPIIFMPASNENVSRRVGTLVVVAK